MKKKICLILVLLFIPFIVNAKEYCKVVSGSLNTIGSEIACGDEHFYLVDSNEEKVKLLTKYNLEVGFQFDRVVLSESRMDELSNACGDVALYNCDVVKESEEFKTFLAEDSNYIDYNSFEIQNENGETEYVFLFQSAINVEKIKQSPKAIAAHGDEKGKPEFPEYGIVQLHPSFVNYDEFIGNTYFNGLFSDFSMEDVPIVRRDETVGHIYLSTYKDYLVEKGYEVNSVDLLSLKDLNDLVKKISGKELPFVEWYDKEWTEEEGTLNDLGYNILGSVKDNLPEDNDWLFNTTYWLKTSGTYLSKDDDGNVHSNFNPAHMLFVDALGNVCMQDACNIAIGAGVRPVIEINRADVIYNITPETDGNGTLDVPLTAEEGEIIAYKIDPKEGYELDEMIIITDSGVQTEITSDDVTCDENNNCVINPDKFKMPPEDITVKVTFKIAIFNPKTGMSGITGLLFTIILISISGLVVFKSSYGGIKL